MKLWSVLLDLSALMPLVVIPALLRRLTGWRGIG